MGARAAGLGAVLLDPVGLYDGFDCLRVQKLSDIVRFTETHNC
jgi:hypothetical protein